MWTSPWVLSASPYDSEILMGDMGIAQPPVASYAKILLKSLNGNDKNISNILLGLSCSLSSPGLSPAVKLEMVFRESCGAWLRSALCSHSPACSVGEFTGTHTCLICLGNCYSGICPNPLWPWNTLQLHSLLYASRFHEFTTPVQRSIHFHSIYSVPPWLCKPQSGCPQSSLLQAREGSQPLLSLLLGQLLCTVTLGNFFWNSLLLAFCYLKELWDICRLADFTLVMVNHVWVTWPQHWEQTGGSAGAPTRKECHLHRSVPNLGPWCPSVMIPMITAVLVFADFMLLHELACNWALVSKYGCNKEPVFPSDNEGLYLFKRAASQWVPSMW